MHFFSYIIAFILAANAAFSLPTNNRIERDDAHDQNRDYDPEHLPFFCPKVVRAVHVIPTKLATPFCSSLLHLAPKTVDSVITTTSITTITTGIPSIGTITVTATATQTPAPITPPAATPTDFVISTFLVKPRHERKTHSTSAKDKLPFWAMVYGAVALSKACSCVSIPVPTNTNVVTTTATDTVAVAPVDVVVSVTVTVTEAVDAVVTTSDGMPSPVFFWGPPPTSFFI